MNGLLQQVVASLDGGAIEQLAGRMGVSPAQAQGAAAGALPSLLDALGQRANTAGGAQGLQALAEQFASVGGGSQTSSLLAGILAQHGGGMTGLAADAGVSGEQAGHLLATLEPLLMNAIAQHGAQGGTAQGLQQMLAVATQHGQALPSGEGLGGMLGSLLGKR